MKRILLTTLLATFSLNTMADTKMLSKYRGWIFTFCVEGYVVLIEDNSMLQLIGKDGKPLRCKGAVHPDIKK